MIEILLLDDEKKVLIEKKEVDFSAIIEKINVENELLLLMDRVENEVIKGVSLSKIYLYEGIEMYNFCRGTFCVNLKNIIAKYLFIYELYELYKDEDISIITDDIIYKQIITKIFKGNCKYQEIDGDSDKSIINKTRLYLKLTKRVSRGIIYLCKRLLSKKNKKILIVTQASNINKIVINKELINYDAQVGYLLEELKKEKDIVRMQFLNNETMLEKADKIGRDFLPYEVYVLIKKVYSRKKIDDSKIENSLNLLNDFNWECKGNDLSEVLKEQLFNIMEQTICSYIKEIITARFVLKKLKIDTVIACDEADRARCIIWAANEKKINTYALQHGIITEASTSYMIPTQEKGYVPNKTFLWGKVYKEVLISNTSVYNNENLVVVGQPRTDYLVKKIACEKEVKNTDKIKILYATQYVWDLTKNATEIFINAIKDIEDVDVIIKLHPVDKYEEFYKKIVEKHKIKNVKITKNMDIYEAIIWCDLIVSIHSTVVLEGAILNKPSICILLEKYHDQGNFVKEGLSKGAKNEIELKELITKGQYRNDNLQEYVEKSFYKIDGKVSERILENIVINSEEEN